MEQYEMNKKEATKRLDQCLDYRLQVARLEKDWVKEHDDKEAIKREFAIYKIMTHFINNRVDADLAKVLATDAYNEAKGDL